MIQLITFTDDRMTISAEKCAVSAMHHGAEWAHTYTPRRLPYWFREHHAELLEQERGCGFYCWKPYIISHAINNRRLQDGDILIYADAGQTFVNSVLPVINSMDTDIFLFSNGWPHVEWCKMDTMEAILPGVQTRHDSGGHLYVSKEYKQTQASLIFFRVSKQSKDFCKEWLAWSLMPGLIDNEPSKLPNYPTFQEHRWDQSILACLQIKYNIPLHWFPTLTAMHLDKGNDHYGPIVDHHRKRNNEW